MASCQVPPPPGLGAPDRSRAQSSASGEAQPSRKWVHCRVPFWGWKRLQNGSKIPQKIRGISVNYPCELHVIAPMLHRFRVEPMEEWDSDTD